MSSKKNIIGTVIAVAIGGSVYTVSQTAIIDNFARDTGMSQQEAKEYVEKTKDKLVSWSEIGDEFIEDSNSIKKAINDINCSEYIYDWETTSLSCVDGKTKLNEIANNELALGNAYKKLDLDSSSKADIPIVIEMIDKVNLDYESSIVYALLDTETISETKKANSYNKATLQAVLQGE